MARRKLKQILNENWKSKDVAGHPGRKVFQNPNKPQNTVVVGREGRIRAKDYTATPQTGFSDQSGVRRGWGGRALSAVPGSRYPKPGSDVTGKPIAGPSKPPKVAAAKGPGKGPGKPPPRKGSEGRKWGAFVNTESGPRQGQRFNVVTRKGEQFNVYADGTAIKNTSGTKGLARGKGYRDVNENSGRSGKAGGGRTDWGKEGAAERVSPETKTSDVTRDADWDKRIAAAREARRKRKAANA